MKGADSNKSTKSNAGHDDSACADKRSPWSGSGTIDRFNVFLFGRIGCSSSNGRKIDVDGNIGGVGVGVGGHVVDDDKRSAMRKMRSPEMDG